MKLTRFIPALFCAALLVSPAAAGTVLFIGDSHSVGPFGWKVDELLRSAGHRTATYASCGSIAQWWVTGKATPCGYFFRDQEGRTEKGQKGPTPIFADLLAALRPDAVIVELGANYAGNPSDEFAIKDMGELARGIKDSGAACYWVTKPDSRKNHDDIARILELTYKAVGDKCEVFDSTRVTKYPETGGDGIHYWFKEGLPIAEAWARQVYDWAAPGVRPAPAPAPSK
jgi:hypothetical protein